MASGQKAKYDPLEAAKLGTDAPAKPAVDAPITTPQPAPKAKDFDVSDSPELPARRPRYRLLSSRRVSIRGQMCDWKAGRVVDSAGFDIEGLRAQGAELELIEE